MSSFMQSSAKPPSTQPAYAVDDGKLRRGIRRLILVRHAKAVEEDVGGDHARGLSERGMGDAKALGAWLLEQGFVADTALCSTATRTRETLVLIAPNVPTILSDKLYLASVHDMLALAQETDDAVHSLLMVGHNPGAHGLLGLLVGSCLHETDADKMLVKFPTAACAIIEFDAARWHDVTVQSGRLVHLRY